MRGGHDLIDVVCGQRGFGSMINHTVNPMATMDEDAQFWGRMGSAIIDPYRASVREGRYGEAVGRGIFDIGSLLIGAGEVGEAARGLGVAGEVGRAGEAADLARVAGTPVRDIDFTSPSYPSGKPRKDHVPPPHQHDWIPNNPNNQAAGYRRSKKPE